MQQPIMNPPSEHPSGSIPPAIRFTGGAGWIAHDPSMTSSSMSTPPPILVFVEHPTSVLLQCLLTTPKFFRLDFGFGVVSYTLLKNRTVFDLYKSFVMYKQKRIYSK